MDIQIQNRSVEYNKRMMEDNRRVREAIIKRRLLINEDREKSLKNVINQETTAYVGTIETGDIERKLINSRVEQTILNHQLNMFKRK